MACPVNYTLTDFRIVDQFILTVLNRFNYVLYLPGGMRII